MRLQIPLLLLFLLVACRQPAPGTISAPATGTAVPALPPNLPPPAPSAATHPLGITPSSELPPVASPGALVTRTPRPTSTPTFPLYDGPPLPQDMLGIQIHLMERDQDEIFQHLVELQVGWVKVQISWKLYEPEPGKYHVDRFAELDDFVQRANQHGLNVLLSVSKAPEWSRPTTEMDGPPTDHTLYRRFMHDLAARYHDRVVAYELWNEPNLQREWNGFPMGGGAFVALLQAGATGARAADPNALLIAGAPAVTGINDRIMAVDDRLFLQEMLQANVAALVDGLGVHPYGFGNPPDSTAVNPSALAHSHHNHPSFFFADTIHDYRQILADANTTLPLWVTEFGWGSFERIADSPPSDAGFMDYVNEQQQAIYVLRALELAQLWELGGPLILWNLNFGPLLGTQFSEVGYSILRPDGSKRPLYYSLAAAAKESE